MAVIARLEVVTLPDDMSFGWAYVSGGCFGRSPYVRFVWSLSHNSSSLGVCVWLWSRKAFGCLIYFNY